MPLARVTRGQPRSLLTARDAWSAPLAAVTATLPKLIVRVRFSSPAPHVPVQVRAEMLSLRLDHSHSIFDRAGRRVVGIPQVLRDHLSIYALCRLPGEPLSRSRPPRLGRSLRRVAGDRLRRTATAPPLARVRRRRERRRGLKARTL